MEVSNAYNPAIDEYISQFPTAIQQKMNDIRQLAHELIPEVQEKISYGMPTFHIKKNLFYFAGHKAHLGFYPETSPIIAFHDQLTPYKTSKGAIQFPYDQPLPLELIKEIMLFRLSEILEKK